MIIIGRKSNEQTIWLNFWRLFCPLISVLGQFFAGQFFAGQFFVGQFFVRTVLCWTILRMDNSLPDNSSLKFFFSPGQFFTRTILRPDKIVRAKNCSTKNCPGEELPALLEKKNLSEELSGEELSSRRNVQR
jgi:hypothetical protein